MKRNISVFIALFIVGLIVLLLGTLVIQNVVKSVMNFLETLPSSNNLTRGAITDKIINKIGINHMKELDKNTIKIIRNSINKGISSIKYVPNTFGNFQGTIFGICKKIISCLLAIYILLDKKVLVARAKRMLYAFVRNERADYIICIINKGNDIFSNFVVGKVIDSAIIGLICFVLLIIVKCPYALLISLVVGTTNVLPCVGPVIGGVVAIIITLITNPKITLLVGLIIALLQQFDGAVLGPKILGDKIGVGAFWIIVAITLSGAIGGVMGMFFGVPMVVLIKNIVEEHVNTRLKKKKMTLLELENLKE
jgi:predicted PurR-regulated permease PerM